MSTTRALLILFLLSAAGAMIYYQWQKPSLVNGDLALDIKGISLQGNSTALSDYKGNYILLEFWGSWCGPCRKKHPYLVKLYQEFKDVKMNGEANFHIFSYALEESENAWRQAIIKDGLEWPSHAVDLDLMKSSAANTYGVNSIPSNFLIDPDFRIIGVNLDDREIRDILLRRISK